MPTSTSEPFEFGFSTHVSLAEEMYDVHYELEIGVVLSGVMRRQWESAERTLCRGDIWINSIWEPHRFSLLESPCNVAVFLLRPEVLASLNLGHLGTGIYPNWLHPFFLPPAARPALPEHRKPVILAWLDRLAGAPRVENVSAEEERHQKTDSFLLLLHLLNCLDKPSAEFGAPAGKDIPVVAPALELVFNRKTIVSEAEGAQVCHMSASTFRRRFKRAMGVPFGQFGLQYRLKSASLDMTGADAIEEIADRWGFSDVSHFHRSFKKMFRKTPAEYRKALANLGVMTTTFAPQSRLPYQY